jgi:hypothetical protein
MKAGISEQVSAGKLWTGLPWKGCPVLSEITVYIYKMQGCETGNGQGGSRGQGYIQEILSKCCTTLDLKSDLCEQLTMCTLQIGTVHTQL